MIISDSFVNSAIVTLLHNRATVDNKMFTAMLEILDSTKDKNGSFNVSVDVQNKIRCVYKFISLRLKGFDNKYIISDMENVELFNNELQSIKTLINMDFDDDSVRNHKKEFENSCETFKLDSVRNMILKLADDIKNKDSKFELASEFNEYTHNIISEINAESNNIKRMRLYTNSNRCVIGVDVKKVYELASIECVNINRTPTGYKLLDNNVLHGGFKKGCIYIIAGGTGAGKSTMMSNFFVNASKIKSEDKKLFIYFSFENTMSQAMERIHCPYFNQNVKDYHYNLLTDTSFAEICDEQFKIDMEKNNSLISCEAYASNSVSVSDLYPIIDNIIQENKCDNIKGIYVDYLRLIKSSHTSIRKDYRIDLGERVTDLRNLAVQYKCPVITATQTNRAGIEPTSSNVLSLNYVGESHQISENSDFIMVVASSPDKNVVFSKICKNRDGDNNIPIDWTVDFGYYKFKDCDYASKTFNIGSNNNIPDGIEIVGSNTIKNNKKNNKKNVNNNITSNEVTIY